MKKWQVVLLVVLALGAGAAALLIYQQRKALAAISGNRKTIGDVADLASSASSVFDDIRGYIKK